MRYVSTLGSILSSCFQLCAVCSVSLCYTFACNSMIYANLLFSSSGRRWPPLWILICPVVEAARYILLDLYPTHYTLGCEVQWVSPKKFLTNIWSGTFLWNSCIPRAQSMGCVGLAVCTRPPVVKHYSELTTSNESVLVGMVISLAAGNVADWSCSSYEALGNIFDVILASVPALS